MIFCLIFIGIAVIAIVGQFYTSACYYGNNSYSKEEIKAVDDPKKRKRMKRETRIYRLAKVTNILFGEADIDEVRAWVAWLVGIVFAIVLTILVCSDASEITIRNANYDMYKYQLEQGYIWNSQESIAKEQRYCARLKAYVDNHPIRTFYNKKDVYALYDKVMTFEIPALEETAEYKISTNRVIGSGK